MQAVCTRAVHVFWWSMYQRSGYSARCRNCMCFFCAATVILSPLDPLRRERCILRWTSPLGTDEHFYDSIAYPFPGVCQSHQATLSLLPWPSHRFFAVSAYLVIERSASTKMPAFIADQHLCLFEGIDRRNSFISIRPARDRASQSRIFQIDPEVAGVS